MHEALSNVRRARPYPKVAGAEVEAVPWTVVRGNRRYAVPRTHVANPVASAFLESASASGCQLLPDWIGSAADNLTTLIDCEARPTCGCPNLGADGLQSAIVDAIGPFVESNISVFA